VLRALPLVPVALLAPQGARATDVGDPPPSLWRTTVVGLDAPLAARLQALQPDTITADDVRSVLRAVPAPRIIALHGSVPLVTMRPFAEFLVAMGYPAPQIRNPPTARCRTAASSTVANSPARLPGTTNATASRRC
jgi:hypothetical protein